MANNKELIRAIKFVLFSASAGIIELLSEIVLGPKLINLTPALAYTIALILSVLWNFTFNRAFTFKSTNNIEKAMLQTFAYYLVFTPVSVFGVALLTTGDVYGWQAFKGLAIDDTIATIIFMILNLVTEYIFQRYVVYKDSIDTKVNEK